MKLLQINIETDKHIDKVTSLVEQEVPDIVCMQEVFETQFEKFKTDLAMDGVYTPMCKKGENIQGTAIFSRTRILNSNVEYYLKAAENISQQIQGKIPLDNVHCSLLCASISVQGKAYNIITTHFPVHYPGHEVSDFQKNVLPA